MKVRYTFKLEGEMDVACFGNAFDHIYHELDEYGKVEVGLQVVDDKKKKKKR